MEVGAKQRIFFRVGWDWTGLELGFVIGIQTGLGLGLFKKKKIKNLSIKKKKRKACLGYSPIKLVNASTPA
jgi:hypothetical protein